METKELFDLLERCFSLSIRGNTKAIQQATALLARIQELETAGRLAYIELENVSNIPVYGWGEEACAAYAGANSKAMEYLAALLNNPPLEKE